MRSSLYLKYNHIDIFWSHYMKRPEEKKSGESLTPSRPLREKPSATRPRRNVVPSVVTDQTRPLEYTSASIVTPPHHSSKSPLALRAKIRPINPIVIDTDLGAASETRTLTKQTGLHQFRPISPDSVAELQESSFDSLLSTEIKPFYDVLYAKIISKLTKNSGYEEASQAEKDEISTMCLEITLAIAHFQQTLLQDPATYCRSAEGMTLWTEKRYLEIKKLQTKIKPHFDRINQLLTEDEYRASTTKQLYSSQTGRKEASRHGGILETTPFGKILESTSIHTTLKQCFGPKAFAPETTGSKNIYKEINGEITRIDINTPRELLENPSVAFTTDEDTAVVIGIWEAVSSSYAQESANEAHIYVPFGIGANTVAWNHEIPELREHFSDENIIIHTLKSPEAYAALKDEYEKKKSVYATSQSNEHIPSDIIFSLRMDRDDAQIKMDNYLNEAKNWTHATFDKSHVNIVTRDKTEVSLQSMKKYVRKLRTTHEEKLLDSKSSDGSQPDSEEKQSDFSNH